MKIRLIVFMFLLVWGSVCVLAEIPGIMNYQGILTDQAGEPVVDGEYNLVLKLYNAETGGEAIWTENQTVLLEGGLFHVSLGKVLPLTLDFSEPYWLGIAVGDETEMEPRIELTSSAYALNAKTVQDSSITKAKVADGELVKSINTFTDDIQIKAGQNVVISSENNVITISAAGSEGGFELPYQGYTDHENDILWLRNTGTGGVLYTEATSDANKSAIFSYQTGLGKAGQFSISSVENASPALYASTTGLGSAGQFRNLNENNSDPTLLVKSRSNSGNALQVISDGYGDAAYFAGNVNMDDTLSVGNIRIGFSGNNGKVLVGTGQGFGEWQDFTGGGITLPYSGTNTSETSAFSISQSNALGSAASFYGADITSSPTVGIDNYGTGVGLYSANFGLGGAAFFRVNNPENNTDAVKVEYSGTGAGLSVTANNRGLAAKFNGSVQVTDTLSINTFQMQNGVGDGFVLTADNKGFGTWKALPASGMTFPFSGSYESDESWLFTLHNSGLGGNVRFTGENTASYNAVLTVREEGDGTVIHATNAGASGQVARLITDTESNNDPSLYVLNKGTGNGVLIRMENDANVNNAISAETNGTGYAGYFGAGGINTRTFTMNDGASTGYVLTSDGVGNGTWQPATALEIPYSGTFDQDNSLFSLHNTGIGGAVRFSSENTVGYASVVSISDDGDGIGLRVASEGTGQTSRFHTENSENTNPTINVWNKGAGDGIFVENDNEENTSHAIYASTNGTGNAVSANKSSAGNVLFVQHNGVSGNLAVFRSDGSNVIRFDKTGKAYFNGGTQTGGADLAEAFEVEGNVYDYEPGDVLTISDDLDRSVEKSTSSYSTKVIGVYATKPGVLLADRSINEKIDDTIPVGVVGVLPTKVSGENGPIKRGDILVTANITGHAMKASPLELNGVTFYPSGTIIGKALENFDNAGTGVINVMVNVK